MKELEKLIDRAEKEMTERNYNKFMAKVIIKIVLLKKYTNRKISKIEKLFEKYKEH